METERTVNSGSQNPVLHPEQQSGMVDPGVIPLHRFLCPFEDGIISGLITEIAVQKRPEQQIVTRLWKALNAKWRDTEFILETIKCY
jgi:hypothetical protein